MSHCILIIDDEPHLPRQIARYLSRQNYEVTTVANGDEGLRTLQEQSIDLVLLDLRLPGMSGLEVLQHIQQETPELPVIMLTAYGDVQSAVTAMKLGACDYLLKGFDLEELLLVIQRALENSAMYRELRQLRSERSDNYHFSYLVGHSERMREIFELVARVAHNDKAPVLISGESGTGKEVVARAIHEQSARSGGPFHPLNCAAIAHHLLESELFGYESYAFTGARKPKRGLLELADGGTLFLDEIGEMPLEMQAKLLRVLETHTFYRLGGQKEVRMNVRIVAATNRNLKQAIEEGNFRQDLYYRLAVFSICLPPLRERPGDILLFAARFVEDFNRSLGRGIQQISAEAQQLLLAYPWPGNVRELKNLIERTMILSNGSELLPSHLPQEIVSYRARQEGAKANPWDAWLAGHPQEALSLTEVLERVEQYFVCQALCASGHRRAQAAEILGTKVDHLRYLVRKYHL